MSALQCLIRFSPTAAEAQLVRILVMVMAQTVHLPQEIHGVLIDGRMDITAATPGGDTISASAVTERLRVRAVVGNTNTHFK